MSEYLIQLNLQHFADEKTEKATPKKRQEAREKGQVARSNEINTALVLLFSFLILKFFGPFMANNVLTIFQTNLSEYVLWEANTDNLKVITIDMLYTSFLVVLPVMLVAMVAGVSANLIQVGFMVTTDPLKMKLEKINPISGLKRMFSVRSLVELFKSILKIAIISSVAFLSVYFQKETLFHLNRLELIEIIGFTADLAIDIGWRVALVLLILSIPDFVYQKYEHEKSIRMSKKDIKDEYKKSEGDPKIKGKRKEIQRKMAIQRMMSNVPKADVIITNPTHFSIAIQYNPDEMIAPIMIAKGTDHLALRIREIATEYDIPLVENKPLAQTLYKTLEVGDAVPESLFQAVAEVLAYVYKLKGKV
ncbi:flagellar biosynthesis protein FlhB [Desulfuribacillus stibiiarsenatis]|uniref:Flagellar biosynthetic protein FlhB n=1 Tax=Desulfuribacillus stibiiarsenatis TaxID=1390249 RepID=A0A1E5L6R8_9FIRM|nr:flagellar biosynthesis protein FlhB [Desulfuribacillus stibiiarsenatis]OEH85835.1 flagellar biosynthesis protein FlhB [Desulfuribacillus stibiiarsenatis]